MQNFQRNKEKQKLVKFYKTKGMLIDSYKYLATILIVKKKNFNTLKFTINIKYIIIIILFIAFTINRGRILPN